MKIVTSLATALTAVALVASIVSPAAQERKPVPKDSVRVSIPGCARSYVFTAGRRSVDEPGSFEIPEGMHLRMNAPKKLMAEIKAHEGSMIEIVGLMKKGQYLEGARIGGVTISPGSSPTGAGMTANVGGGQIWIDVEGWRQLAGGCRTQ